MVFSSLPAYLDPSNWQQQSVTTHQATGSSIGGNSHQLLPPPPPAPPTQHLHGIGGTGSIRPGSMSERARMANISLPEAALKCPRCDSTNTKFCYFNNYSLSQPRHFCKTCRRYWTKGGALRNVPVGGGCRRNKRTKGSSSKSPATSDRQISGGSGSSSAIPSNSGHSDIISLGPQIPPLRFMSPLHHLTDFTPGDIGLNYGMNNFCAISAPMSGCGDLNFQIATGLGGGAGVGGTSLLGLDQQWRLQQPPQFPFLSGFDMTQGMFESGGQGLGFGGQARQRTTSSGGLTQQMGSVKLEESGQQEGGMGRGVLGIQGNEAQYWSGTSAWSDLSGFSTSSTTSNPL